MPDTDIKSGEEVVTDFLAAMENNPNVDPDTLGCILRLRANGKVTKTSLLKELQNIRTGDNSSDEA